MYSLFFPEPKSSSGAFQRQCQKRGNGKDTALPCQGNRSRLTPPGKRDYSNDRGRKKAVIEISQVSRLYRRGADEVHALERVSLQIPDGAFVALMGPSGSGKSTLLNLIAGLDQPSSGTIRVGGQVLSGFSEDQLAAWRAAHVGFVFQFYNLIPVLTAAEREKRLLCGPSAMTMPSACRYRRVKTSAI
jgi:ABC-type glutathione transport system ATPase component